MQKTKIGIITGGQLGLMLIQELVSYPVEIYVMDKSPDAPCRQLCHSFTEANPLDEESVYQFGKDLDVVVLEFEHVSIAGLKRLQSDGIQVFPDPDALAIIQDKSLQKQFFEVQEFPTAHFRTVNQGDDLTMHADFFPVVMKQTHGGYDGGGVQVLNELPEDPIAPADAIIEAKIDFAQELSVVVCRDAKGNTKAYPVVAQEFHPDANLVEVMYAPAPISKSEAKAAQELAVEVVNRLGYVGVMAVELFETKDGELLINELAPRTHNSGHHTIEANETSQFGQMARIALGLPLGSTRLISPAATANLLGAEDSTGLAIVSGVEEALAENERAFVHLYNKKQTRLWRKMGHLTVLAKKVEEALDQAKALAHKITIHS